VHQRRGLILDRLGQMRMAMAEQVDCDAAREIELALAALADQIGALAANRTHGAPGVNGHQRRDRHGESSLGSKRQKAARKRAALQRNADLGAIHRRINASVGLGTRRRAA
jgi:hypothetical protein